MPKGRERTGYVYYDEARKTWTARVTYRDEAGRVRNIKRQVENKTAGKLLLKKLIRELDDHGAHTIDGDHLTFKALSGVYEARKLGAPVYKGETRISGLRSHETLSLHLRTLTTYFGSRRVKSLTHLDLEKFKAERLATTTKLGRERTVASVNRELQLLRAVLNFARRQGWIQRNPFEMGEPLIQTADEVKRDRLLTPEEETRLLAACEKVSKDERKRWAHLRPIIICALDTAMRQGEILKLKWSDVDLDGGLIRVRATTTKTLRARTIGMTTRLQSELRRLWENSKGDLEASIFGLSDNVKHGFAAVCAEAGVADFRFHDLRHAATTRMISAGMPPLEVMKITGHTQMATFTRYVNANEAAARRGAAALDGFHAEVAAKAEMIN